MIFPILLCCFSRLSLNRYLEHTTFPGLRLQFPLAQIKISVVRAHVHVHARNVIAKPIDIAGQQA